jgi:hypothetical protein
MKANREIQRPEIREIQAMIRRENLRKLEAVEEALARVLGISDEE